MASTTLPSIPTQTGPTSAPDTKFHDAAQAAAQAASLGQRAMLAILEVRGWSGKKLDRKVSREIAVQKKAAIDAGRYNKTLISPDNLAAIGQAATAIRHIHYDLTMPWGPGKGIALLPTAAHREYTDKIRAARGEWESAVADFCTKYIDLIEDAPQRLGDMFNRQDYPSTVTMHDRFSVEINFQAIPEGDDLRVNLSEQQTQRLADGINRRVSRQLQKANQHVTERVYEALERMAEGLAGFDPNKSGKERGTFRDSLVLNVQHLARLLPSLNVAQDPKLDEAHAAIEQRILSIAGSASELREDTDKRQRVAAEAADIVKTMKGYAI